MITHFARNSLQKSLFPGNFERTKSLELSKFAWVYSFNFLPTCPIRANKAWSSKNGDFLGLINLCERITTNRRNDSFGNKNSQRGFFLESVSSKNIFWCFHVLQRVLSRHISPFPWEKTLGELLAHFGAASFLTSGLDTCWDFTPILPDRRHLRRENGSLQGASASRRSEEICCVLPEGTWWCIVKKRFLD